MAQPRKSSKKSGGSFSTIVMVIIVAIVVVAFVRANGGVSGVWEWANSKSHEVGQKYEDVQSKGLDLPSDDGKGSGETSTSSPSVSESLTVLSSIKTADRSDAKYNRDDYKHWVTYGGSSCWDARDEVLYRSAEKGTVVLLDKSKNETTDKSKACSIESGSWVDPYTGSKIDKPRALDIDHVVPLSLANASGASDWDANKKQTFANDIDDNLIASSASANRQKGDKGPSDWLPKNKDFQCEYVEKFVNVIQKYDLTMTPADKEKSQEVLESCK